MARKFALSVLASSFLAASSAFADSALPTPPTPPTPPPAKDADLDGVKPNGPRPTTAQQEAEFADLVFLGDEARKAGNWAQAVAWYDTALGIRPDPLVQGRLGLVYFATGQRELDASAANHLYVAVLRSSGVNKAERKQIWEAYDAVLRRVCRLTLTTNFAEAEIRVDEGPFTPSFGLTWTFILRGKHAAKGRLTGYPDIEKTFECTTNEDVNVDFEFVETPNAEPPAQAPVPAPPAKIFFVRDTQEAKPAQSVGAALPQTPTKGAFNIGVGATMILGAAPSTSLGAVLSASYRRDNISGMIGARGAWALGDVNRTPIDIFAATAFGGPCAHVRWFGACALASINAIHYRLDTENPAAEEAHDRLIPGVGIGINGEFLAGSNLHLRVSGDLTVLSRDVVLDKIWPDETSPIWHGGRILAGVSTMIVF